MRVVLLLTQDLGGPVDLTVSVARELSGRPGGPDLTVVGPAPASLGGRPWSLLRPLHVRSKTDLSGVAAAGRLIRGLAPDIIHAQDRRAGLVASLMAGQTPVVLTFHGVPDVAAGRWVQGGPLHGRSPGLAGSSRMVADAVIARRVTCTIAPSNAIAAFLRTELRVPPGQVRVLTNGVAIPRRPLARREVLIFATAGGFAPSKATPLLVEAFAPLALSRPGVRLIMIGDGQDRGRCQEIARRAGVADQVEFTGYRADVGPELARADAFVLPSLNENLPLALLQAMAAGLPCIAADVGGVSEALGGGSGLLITPGSIGELRAAMLQLISQPELGIRLAAAARSRAAQQFSLPRCADEHLRLWADVLARQQRR
ncbi:MAG TPA: glycosyltransferase family 4 protein [Streptosporangiaceae bacterium]